MSACLSYYQLRDKQNWNIYTRSEKVRNCTTKMFEMLALIVLGFFKGIFPLNYFARINPDFDHKPNVHSVRSTEALIYSDQVIRFVDECGDFWQNSIRAPDSTLLTVVVQAIRLVVWYPHVHNQDSYITRRSKRQFSKMTERCFNRHQYVQQTFSRSYKPETQRLHGVLSLIIILEHFETHRAIAIYCSMIQDCWNVIKADDKIHRRISMDCVSDMVIKWT